MNQRNKQGKSVIFPSPSPSTSSLPLALQSVTRELVAHRTELIARDAHLFVKSKTTSAQLAFNSQIKIKPRLEPQSLFDQGSVSNFQENMIIGDLR